MESTIGTSPVQNWGVCCSRSNREFVKYIVQVTFGLIVMIFAMVQITLGTEGREIYFSLISGTMGLFFPQPIINSIASHERLPLAPVEVDPPPAPPDGGR